MKFDLITVARTTDQNLIKTTQDCINSFRQDEVDLNVIVVETSGSKWNYNGADEIVMYEGDFCYNHALNLGLEKAKGDIHILANNDLIAYKGWSVIGEGMVLNGFPSGSALSQDHRQRAFNRGDWIYPGYGIGTYLTGWCIFLTREGLQTIGGSLWDGVDFWYSDNLYADQLIHYGVRHGLFCNVRIDHITSATLKSTPPSHQRKMATGSQMQYSILKRSGDYERKRH